jgi:membrane protease YdiL (CAAX protease family)
MTTKHRPAARIAAILSIVLAVWGLAFVAFPFGAIGAAIAAAFGLVFGCLALRRGAWGRWRKAALAGSAISILVLVIFAAEVVFLVFFE